MPSFARAVTAGVLAALGALSADAAAASCVDRVVSCDVGVDQFPDKVDFAYANRSTIPGFAYANTHVDADVVSNTLEQTFRYRFVRCGCEDAAAAADGGDGRVVVPVPVAGAFVGDSVILGMLDGALDAGDRVKAVGPVDFVYSPAMRDAVANGSVASVTKECDYGGPMLDLSLLEGEEENLGVGVGVINEFVVAMWDSGYTGDVPRVVSAESGEAEPLGRAEWIKFFGLLVGKEARAAEQFAAIETRYKEISTRAFSTHRRPSVLANYPFAWVGAAAGTWSQPGGAQYTAALFRDANVDFRNANGGEKGTSSLSLAEVEQQFGSARTWVNAGRFPNLNDDTIDNLVGDELVNEEFRATFRNLASVKCGNVWSQSKEITEDGSANNFFEEGPLRPDLVLEDILEIFHPDVSDKSPEDLKFYYKLGAPTEAAGLDACPYNTLPNTAPDGKTFHVTELEIKGKDRFAVEDELAQGEMEPAIAAANDISAEDVEVFFNRLAEPGSDYVFASVRALADDDAGYDHEVVADTARTSLNADEVNFLPRAPTTGWPTTMTTTSDHQRCPLDRLRATAASGTC